MSEFEVKEKKFVTVTFPARQWNIKESASFEEFVRWNGPEITRIFRKLGVIRT